MLLILQRMKTSRRKQRELKLTDNPSVYVFLFHNVIHFSFAPRLVSSSTFYAFTLYFLSHYV
jgi:hypothetical protein